jgi:hypothetical protein
MVKVSREVLRACSTHRQKLSVKASKKAVDKQLLPVYCDQRAINEDKFLKTGRSKHPINFFSEFRF